MIDCMLVTPSIGKASESPSYGLLWLASYIREHGYKVMYLDGNALNINNHQIALAISTIKPRVVGITATTRSYPDAQLLIRETRKMCDSLGHEVIIVLGGPHATFLPNECIHENPALNFVVTGDGFSSLLTIIEEGITQDICTLFNGENVDINKLPLPAWDLIDLKDYTGNYPVLDHFSTTTFSSIGCPHKCAFCSLHYKKPRFRKTDLLIKELKILRDKGAQEIFLYDDEFNLNPKHALAVCEEIIVNDLHHELSFKCQMRGSAFHNPPTLLKRMKEANFSVLYYGIESGSQRVLDAIHKEIDVEELELSLESAHQYGLQTYGFFMVQNLNETFEDVKLTGEFIKRNRKHLDYHQITIATPYPGSELWYLANTHGWLVKGFDFSQLNTYKAVMNTPWMNSQTAEVSRIYLERLFNGRHGLKTLARHIIPLKVRQLIRGIVK